jgi:hypothetical protein
MEEYQSLGKVAFEAKWSTHNGQLIHSEARIKLLDNFELAADIETRSWPRLRDATIQETSLQSSFLIVKVGGFLC